MKSDWNEEEDMKRRSFLGALTTSLGVGFDGDSLILRPRKTSCGKFAVFRDE